MSARPNELVIKQIGRLFRDGTVAGLGDGDLLARFVVRRDETAFEALVSRHGPMVLGVCRRILTDPHDADDAFQATFLVLVRKARGIRDADRLAPWLYGVAHRIACRARVRAARRAKNETTAIDFEPSARGGLDELVDVRSIIDAELARLSAKHREVLVLCLLEGLSPDEAAVRLRCPTGTIKSRLARGRETLKGRLTARGLAPSVVASAVLGSAEILRASSVPERLLTPLLRATVDPAVSLGLGVATLTREAIIPMVSKSWKLSMLLVAGMGVGAFGIVEVVRSTALARQTPPATPIPEEDTIQGALPAPRGPLSTGPAVERLATPREVTILRMKQILLAFHNYHDVNGKLPFYQGSGRPTPSGVLVPPGGLPPPAPARVPLPRAKLSWRVAILPFVGQRDLYERFLLDEPWDSEHNLAVAAQIPEVFLTPDHPAPAGQTRFRVFSGEGTAFDGEVGWQDVTDGLSNTMVLGISPNAVPWTKPDGMDVTADNPLPSLADGDAGGPLVGMLDGSVRRLKPRSYQSRSAYRALTSIAGGEVILAEVFDPSPIDPTGPPPVLPLATPPLSTDRADMSGPPALFPGMMGTSAPSPSIEQRLEAIERKLDLLLQQSKDANRSVTPQPTPPEANSALGVRF